MRTRNSRRREAEDPVPTHQNDERGHKRSYRKPRAFPPNINRQKIGKKLLVKPRQAQVFTA
jgi:hypothetical protein